MKKHALMLLAVLLLMVNIYGQIPQGFNYQAVLRDSSGEIIENQEKTITVNIIQKSLDSSAIYTEAHVLTTNDFGLVNMIIGEGTTTDDFSAINWAEGPYFIEISVEGIKMGAQQLMSVPYALKAQESSTIEGYNTNDLQRILEDMQFITELKIKDIDGNIYPTVRVNNTLWMAADLKTKRYADGREIVQYTTDIPADTIGNYWLPFYYETPDTFNGEGLFYTITAISDSTFIPYDNDGSDSSIIMQGICPDGWRLPNRSDLMELHRLYKNEHYKVIAPEYLTEQQRQGSTGLNFNLNGYYSYFVDDIELFYYGTHGLYYLASNTDMEFKNDVICIEKETTIWENIRVGNGRDNRHFLPVRCVKDLE